MSVLFPQACFSHFSWTKFTFLTKRSNSCLMSAWIMDNRDCDRFHKVSGIENSYYILPAGQDCFITTKFTLLLCLLIFYPLKLQRQSLIHPYFHAKIPLKPIFAVVLTRINASLWAVPVYRKVIGDWGGSGKSRVEPGTVLGTTLRSMQQPMRRISWAASLCLPLPVDKQVIK